MIILETVLAELGLGGQRSLGVGMGITDWWVNLDSIDYIYIKKTG